jgi:hypothetical protein
MENFTFLPDKIKQIQKEIGLTNFIGFFEMAANELPKIINTNKLSIDVFYSSVALTSIREAIKVLQKDADFNYNFLSDISKLTSHHFPNIQATVALLLIDNDFISEGFIDKIAKFKKEDYHIVLIKNYTENTEIENLLKNKLKSNVEIFNLELNDLELNSQVIIELKNKDCKKLIDISVLQTCIPIINTLKEIIETESKINFTQKQLASQDNVIIRKEESSFSNNDLTTSARQIIQKNILDIEKGFKTKYDELNKPIVGNFYLQLDDFINKISFEDIDQFDVAEKSEKIETKLNASKSELFKENIVNSINNEFKKDLIFLNSSCNDGIEKINNLLASKNLPKIKKDNFINPDIQSDKIVSSNNYIQRPYLGEITKKGVMEYFIALRDYTGMIMVVVGIFSPLLMMSSTSDDQVGFWSFLNKISAVLRLAKQPIQLITIILIAFMIIYGIFDLRKRIPRKREEERERELKKVKENLMQEGRRIYADISRDWVAMLSNYLRELAQNITNEMDGIFKASVSDKQLKLGAKKNEIQLSQQSIELKNKNMQIAEKEFDMLFKKVIDIKEKLNK